MTIARFLLCAALTVPLSAGAPSADELVRKSLANYQQAFKQSLAYSYVQRDEEKEASRPKVTMSEVINLEGTPYEKVIARNGVPLAGEDKLKEDRKFQEAAQKRAHESASEKAARIRKYMDTQSFLRDVPDAFNFKLLGEQAIDGRPSYLVECNPKPGYHAKSRYGAMFEHIHAKLWIDKQDLQWTRADADVIGTISIGWIMARIGPGAKMRLEQSPVAKNLWLPKVIDVDGAAKVMLVKNHPIHEHLTFTGYKPGSERAALNSKP